MSKSRTSEELEVNTDVMYIPDDEAGSSSLAEDDSINHERLRSVSSPALFSTPVQTRGKFKAAARTLALAQQGTAWTLKDVPGKAAVRTERKVLSFSVWAESLGIINKNSDLFEDSNYDLPISNSSSKEPLTPEHPNRHLASDSHNDTSGSTCLNEPQSPPVSSNQNESLKVYVRIRPITDDEREQGEILKSQRQKISNSSSSQGSLIGIECVRADGNDVVVDLDQQGGAQQLSKRYSFTGVFNPNVRQQEVYDRAVYPVLKKFTDGYNGCIFCYGQTGSGKTYTMLGDKSSLEGPGIIPRVLIDLFLFASRTGGKDHESRCSVEISVLEVYNEALYDLLIRSPSIDDNEPSPQSKLEIMNDKIHGHGTFVKGISEISVKDSLEALAVLEQGIKARSVGDTNMNSRSSRSHLVFSVSLTQWNADDSVGMSRRTSRLHMIDLAGSERYSATDGHGKGRMREGAAINKSLSSLGNVINDIVKGQKVIRYRESKLTYLLQTALGGNSVTTVIGTISPATINSRESQGTLLFADRARMVRNPITVALSPMQKKMLELEKKNKNLRAEVERLEPLKNFLIDREKVDQKINQMEELNKSMRKTNEKTLEDLRARLSDAEDRISEKARLLEDMQSSFDSKDAEVKDMEKKMMLESEKMLNLEKELQLNRNEKSILQDDLRVSAEEVEALRSSLDEERNKLNQRESILNSQAKAAESKVRSMESELEERDRTHEALNREINDLKDKLSKENDEQKIALSVEKNHSISLKARLSEIESELRQNQEQLLTAQSQLKKSNKNLEDSEAMRKDIENDLSQSIKLSKELELQDAETKGKLSTVLISATDLKNALRNAKKLRNDLEIELETLRNENQSLRTTVDSSAQLNGLLKTLSIDFHETEGILAGLMSTGKKRFGSDFQGSIREVLFRDLSMQRDKILLENHEIKKELSKIHHNM
eukprot:UC4_evm3s1268